MTDKELLGRIEQAEGERAGFKQLVREAGLRGGEERHALMEQLLRLTRQGELIPAERGRWAIARAGGTRENLIAGRLSIHRDGYGFVRMPGAPPKTDVFIPAHSMAGAMQGDQVLVEVAPGRQPDRREGRVLRVLTRRNPTIVGIFHYAHDERAAGHRVVAFDAKITQPIVVPFDSPLPEAKAALRTPHRVLGEEAAVQIATYPDLENLVVDVEVTEWPTETRTARGRVVEVLGRQDDFGVDVEMVIRKHQLPRVFPNGVLAEARDRAALAAEGPRRDFRGRTIVTIDGETARDFDDAVEVRTVEDGWELDVHIADVAEYVQAGGLLDLEARLRGTSVYFPDRAIPMLPQEFSTGICSLKPDEDRLVLSCLMRIDGRGEITGFEVCEGVICSVRRMTYTAVAACLDGKTTARSEYGPLADRFDEMQRLARVLNRKRVERGSIDFDLPEPAIEFDEQGVMQGVRRAERNWAHRLIEEFMLAANESVASWLSVHAPALYRIHEKPDPRRILDFEDIAAGFGYSLGIGNLPVKRFAKKHESREKRHSGNGGRTQAHEVPEEIPVTPRMYQQLARRLEGKPEERILHYLMLRSLKQARYSEENEGHFALAASFYTHFTSPIRRYPDLIVHRVAKALLRSGVSGQGEIRTGEPAAFDGAAGPVPLSELTAIGTESSETERRADAAERELVEWKKIRFMAGKVGEEFDGLVLNATKYGLFVELTDLFVEGLVPIGSLSELDGDRYTYRENTREIIGEVWARRFRVGQKVRVLLERVNAVEKRLMFGIVLPDGEEVPKVRAVKAGKKRRIPAPKGFGKKRRK